MPRNLLSCNKHETFSDKFFQVVNSIDENQHLQRRRPQQQRSIDKVELILDSVEKLVIVHGAESLTTTQIAQESGVAVGTIYQYFGNRTELLISAHDRILNRLAADFMGEAQQLDVTDDSSIEKLIRLFVHKVHDHAGYLALLNFAYLHKASIHTDVSVDDFIGGLVNLFLSKRVPTADPSELIVVRTVAINILRILVSVLLFEKDSRLQERYIEEIADHTRLLFERAEEKA